MLLQMMYGACTSLRHICGHVDIYIKIDLYNIIVLIQIEEENF